VGRAPVAALAVFAAGAVPAQAFAEPVSLAEAFESVARAARAVEVEPKDANPCALGRAECLRQWFPVRGVIDFGESDARFGAWRGGHRHEGQDVFAEAGTPLVSMQEGRVVEKGDDGGRGNYVAIWSAETARTFVYLHMGAPTPFEVGDPVDAGQRIGAVGCTGSCWGDHLHLEMRAGRGTTGRPLDPLTLLRRLARRARPAASG
jgi:murein DD-endopeptidase MepM/ murein hydrolase activator NlpD